MCTVVGGGRLACLVGAARVGVSADHDGLGAGVFSDHWCAQTALAAPRRLPAGRRGSGGRRPRTQDSFRPHVATSDSIRSVRPARRRLAGDHLDLCRVVAADVHRRARHARLAQRLRARHLGGGGAAHDDECHDAEIRILDGATGAFLPRWQAGRTRVQET